MKALILLSLVSVHTLAAVCSTTDGSAVNGAACTCGSMECTSTTGLICYSTYGGGSCRKTDVGAFGYPKEAGPKTCASVNNRHPMLDKASCEAAATSMGLDDVTADEASYSNYPPGCFGIGNNLYYNTKSTSTKSCNNGNTDFCLCVAATDCTQTNGATSNTDACLCGGTRCTADSGLFCYASNSQCSLVAIPDCLTTDGSVANGAACTCRDATCTAASSLFCYAEISKCSTTAFSNLCPIRDGSAANTVACTCGSVECTSTTGLICFSTYGGGSCRKTGLGPFGYTKEDGDTNCGSVSNRIPILDKAACEAAATSMDLDDVTASEVSVSYTPPGCYFWNNGLYYNTQSTSTTSCNNGNSDFCLCVAASDCTHTNGLLKNTATCSCGATGATVCTATTGLFCTKSTNTCRQIPICTVTDASAANNASCACGMSDCTNGTGLVCDYANNQCGHDCATVGTKQLCFVTSSVVDCSVALNICANNTAAVKTWYNKKNGC